MRLIQRKKKFDEESGIVGGARKLGLRGEVTAQVGQSSPLAWMSAYGKRVFPARDKSFSLKEKSRAPSGKTLFSTT